LDALYLGSPCFCFAYDRPHYESTQRGMFYSLDELFENRIHYTLSSLLEGIGESLISERPRHQDPASEKLSARFFQWKDAGNSGRVVERVRDLDAGAR